MAKENKKIEDNKTSKHKFLQGKKKFMLPIFSDEFNKFDLNDTMTTFDAQTKVREVLGLPKRQKAIYSVKSRLRQAVKEMSDEEIEKLLNKLE
jgi:hypothetical protein